MPVILHAVIIICCGILASLPLFDYPNVPLRPATYQYILLTSPAYAVSAATGVWFILHWRRSQTVYPGNLRTSIITLLCSLCLWVYQYWRVHNEALQYGAVGAYIFLSAMAPIRGLLAWHTGVLLIEPLDRRNSPEG